MSNRPAARPGCTRWKPCDEDPRRSLALAPAFYTLVTCGAFTAEGEFLDVPERDLGRLETDWQEAVFALYLAEEKVTPRGGREPAELAARRLQCRPVRVYLPAGERAGIERLVGYMTRCPFSLSRLARVTETGQVVYKAEKDVCPKCQGAMKVIAFIEPPQAAVIEKILRHCGLWHSSRAPPADGDFVHDARAGTARRRATSRGSWCSSPTARPVPRRKVSSTPTPSPTTRPTSGIAGRARPSRGN